MVMPQQLLSIYAHGYWDNDQNKKIRESGEVLCRVLCHAQYIYDEQNMFISK